MQEHWKLRPNEIYETVFKEKVKQGPISSMNCKGYDRHHNNGFCYTAYNNKDPHCKLYENDKKTFDAYIKQLKGE